MNPLEYIDAHGSLHITLKLRLRQAWPNEEYIYGILMKDFIDVPGPLGAGVNVVFYVKQPQCVRQA